LSFTPPAKFVRQFGDAAGTIRGAVKKFKAEVEASSYPGDAESYHLPAETKAAFDAIRTRRLSMAR
jgi:3-methyl-2-oxobutanoate hydroxymethyltransferase